MFLFVLFFAIAVPFGAYILFQVVRQNGRILMRLDAVERDRTANTLVTISPALRDNAGR